MASTKTLTLLEPAWVNRRMYPAGTHTMPVADADKIISGSPQIIQKRKGQDYVEATIERLLQTSAAETPAVGTLVPGGGEGAAPQGEQILNQQAAAPAQDPMRPRNENPRNQGGQTPS